jgi:hypothetical protein
MRILIALFAGMLFGAGLTVAQMVNPMKILNFLDIAAIFTGRWDPTLLFVFAGALPVMFVAYVLQRRLSRPLLADRFEIPTRSEIDRPLVAGAAIFGIGWGLAGLCPGPAVASLAIARDSLGSIALFILAMIAGMALLQVVRGAPRQSGAVKT